MTGQSGYLGNYRPLRSVRTAILVPRLHQPSGPQRGDQPARGQLAVPPNSGAFCNSSINKQFRFDPITNCLSNVALFVPVVAHTSIGTSHFQS